MKLLFDENLSRRSPDRLQDLFPGSSHVALVGYKSSSDLAIADYAVDNDFVVVTKDHDLQEIALTSRPRLRIILLHVGNMSAEFIEALLRRHASEIASLASPESALRILIIEEKSGDHRTRA